MSNKGNKKTTRLLKGIGIQNFKAFSEYTYMPIEDISIFIGPNGSGKSSFWQILSLLSKCLKEEPNKSDLDNGGVVYKTTFSLHDYSDLGTEPDKLLYDPTKPLIIELHSNVYIKENYYLQNDGVIFRLSLTPSTSKSFKDLFDYTKKEAHIDSEPRFELESFELLDAERNTIMNFLWKENLNEIIDWKSQKSYVIRNTATEYDLLGQFLLNTAYDLISLIEDKTDISPIIEQLQKQTIDFFEWTNQKSTIKYISGAPDYDENVNARDTNFSFFLRNGRSGDIEGLHILYDIEITAENYADVHSQIKKDKPLLYDSLKLVFGLLQDTFKELMSEVGRFYVLDKRKVGFSDMKIPEDSATGKLLLDFIRQETLFEDFIRDNDMVIEPEDLDLIIKKNDPEELDGLIEKIEKKLSSDDESTNIWSLPDFNNNINSLHEPQFRGISFKKTFLNLGFKKPPAIKLDKANSVIRIFNGEENIRNSGMGFWSLTFIIYAVIKAFNEKSILILEEPEINLHPDLQVELMDALIEFSQKWDMTIIIETHSEYMLRRLQLRAYEGGSDKINEDSVEEVKKMLLYNNFRSVKIKPSNVVINSFEQDHSKQISKSYYCNVIKLDENGTLDKALPRSFSSVAANDALLLNIWNRGDM